MYADGIFSHPAAGKLLLVFNATFLKDGAPQGNFDRVTDPYGFATGYFGTFPAWTTFSLNAKHSTASFELDYPGGDLEIPVGFYIGFYAVAGVYTLTVNDLRISCQLAIGA